MISNEEKGKNKTSFSYVKYDICSISAWVDKLYFILWSFWTINNALHSPGFGNFLFINFSAIFLSLLNDKNTLEKTILVGKLEKIFLCNLISSISLIDTIVPLYKILLLEAKGKDSNSTPLYKALINGKYKESSILSLFLKSLFKVL